jgi:microcystin-dependent protein
MGGAATNRLTAASKAELDGTKLGAAGGTQEYKLKGKESGVAKHVHEGSTIGITGGGDPSKPLYGELTDTVEPTGAASNRFSRRAAEADATEAHTNLQPTIVVNYIILFAIQHSTSKISRNMEPILRLCSK